MDKENKGRKGRAEEVKGAFFLTPPALIDMPGWYGEMLDNSATLRCTITMAT